MYLVSQYTFPKTSSRVILLSLEFRFTFVRSNRPLTIEDREARYIHTESGF